MYRCERFLLYGTNRLDHEVEESKWYGMKPEDSSTYKVEESKWYENPMDSKSIRFSWILNHLDHSTSQFNLYLVTQRKITLYRATSFVCYPVCQYIQTHLLFKGSTDKPAEEGSSTISCSSAAKRDTSGTYLSISLELKGEVELAYRTNIS